MWQAALRGNDKLLIVAAQCKQPPCSHSSTCSGFGPLANCSICLHRAAGVQCLTAWRGGHPASSKLCMARRAVVTISWPWQHHAVPCQLALAIDR